MAGVLAVLIAIAGAIAWHDTMRDPEVLTARLELAALPPQQAPLRLLLLSDLHVAGPDMPPERLAHIVELANAQHADLVLLAGDFISDRRLATHRYSYREAMAPLAAIRAPLGAVAVLGNHDHWRDAARGRAELTRIGVTVLANSAVRRGPLAIGGIDDDFAQSHLGYVTFFGNDGDQIFLLNHFDDPLSIFCFFDINALNRPADKRRLQTDGKQHIGQRLVNAKNGFS